MTNTLPHDRYYRGYRLSICPNGETNIYWEAEEVDSAESPEVAQRVIDEWLDAR